MDTQTQAISLVKGQKTDLTKTNPGLQLLACGLGWDVNAGNAGSFDLDAIAVAVDANNKCVQGQEGLLIYAKAPQQGAPFECLGGSLKHTGDNLTGQGDGDDETIHIDLTKLPTEVQAVLLFASIYDAKSKGQSYGQVRNAYIRCYNVADKAEIFKYDLQEDYGQFSNVLFGRVYRHGTEWKFEALGEGLQGDLKEVLSTMGISIS